MFGNKSGLLKVKIRPFHIPISWELKNFHRRQKNIQALHAGARHAPGPMNRLTRRLSKDDRQSAIVQRGDVQRFFMTLGIVALLTSCAISSDGSVGVSQPTQVQGSNDAQGTGQSIAGKGGVFNAPS